MASAGEVALPVAKVFADAQQKAKGYLPRIESRVDDPAQCITESHLDNTAVEYATRHVGKVGGHNISVPYCQIKVASFVLKILDSQWLLSFWLNHVS